MSENVSRRTFLKRAALASLLSTLSATGLDKPVRAAEAGNGQLATLIDLTKCDGCRNHNTPLCVQACSQHNQDHYPEPIKPIRNYWPQKKFEDWSGKRDLKNRLTPYNWTFVDRVKVEHSGAKPVWVSTSSLLPTWPEGELCISVTCALIF